MNPQPKWLFQGMILNQSNQQSLSPESCIWVDILNLMIQIEQLKKVSHTMFDYVASSLI